MTEWINAGIISGCKNLSYYTRQGSVFDEGLSALATLIK